MSETRVVAHLWVCTDCHLAHHGYTEHELGYKPETEPRAPRAPVDVAGYGDPENEPHFSWWHCEGCGSTLGGDRHEYVYFSGERA